MIQQLYYNTASLTITLIDKDYQPQTWSSITNLITCGSLGQIIAFSGSTQVAKFSIDNTNLYYDLGNTGPTRITTQSLTPVTYKLTFNNDAQPYVYYKVTSSLLEFSGSGVQAQSGGNYQSYDTLTFIVGSNNLTINYMLKVSIYDATRANYQLGIPGLLLTETSSSVYPTSASVYLENTGSYLISMSMEVYPPNY